MNELAPTLYFGTALAMIHAAIPNHWIPIVVLGRTYDWSRAKVIGIAALCGSAHVLSTVLIGVMIGAAGKAASERYELFVHYVGPGILIGLGLVLIVLDLLGKSHHHGRCHGPMDHHDQDHDHQHGHQHLAHETQSPPAGSGAAIAAVTLAMFLSPCIELMAYFLRAGQLGWRGIASLALTYLVVTVGGIILLVAVFSAGYRRVRWRLLEYHERLVSGSVLILAGIVAFMMHNHAG